MSTTAEPRDPPARPAAVSVVLRGVMTAVVILGCAAVLRSDMTEPAMGATDPHMREALASTDASELRATLQVVLRELDAARDAGARARRERDRLRLELVAIEQRLHRLQNATATVAGSGRVLDARLDGDDGGMTQADADLPGRAGSGGIARILSDIEARFVALQWSRQRIVQRVQSGALRQVIALERAIAETGLDVEALLSSEPDETAEQERAADAGRGGPFIADRGRLSGHGAETDATTARLDAHLRHWEALQSLVRRLPLAAPLDSYTINSEFGRRRDPVNGRRAIHQGVDFHAQRKAPVRAPAPGTVVFAGRNGGYGRFVEIDHGFGLSTAYAHLDDITVKVGRVVALGDMVGALGNSGRSTGAHLHYEVRYRGEPMDPMAFIRAGRSVHLEQAAAAVEDRFGAPVRRPASRH